MNKDYPEEAVYVAHIQYQGGRIPQQVRNHGKSLSEFLNSVYTNYPSGKIVRLESVTNIDIPEIYIRQF